jgi:hypothetical protein
MTTWKWLWIQLVSTVDNSSSSSSSIVAVQSSSTSLLSYCPSAEAYMEGSPALRVLEFYSGEATIVSTDVQQLPA